MAESKEELKSLLMKVKPESEKAGLKLRKLRSWHPIFSFLKQFSSEGLSLYFPIRNKDLRKNIYILTRFLAIYEL